jgi:hypothetical protein
MELEDKEFEFLKIERSVNDWLHCKVENKDLKGPEVLETLRRY